MFYLKFKQWQNIIRGKSQPRFTLLWFSSKFLICLQQKLSRSATWPKYLINASGECGAGRRKQVADSDLPLENSPKSSEYSCWCKPKIISICIWDTFSTLSHEFRQSQVLWIGLGISKEWFFWWGEYRNAQMSNFWVKKRSIWIISTEIQLKQTEKKEKVWNLIWGKEGEKRSKNETVIRMVMITLVTKRRNLLRASLQGLLSWPSQQGWSVACVNITSSRSFSTRPQWRFYTTFRVG